MFVPTGYGGVISPRDPQVREAISQCFLDPFLLVRLWVLLQRYTLGRCGSRLQTSAISPLSPSRRFESSVLWGTRRTYLRRILMMEPVARSGLTPVLPTANTSVSFQNNLQRKPHSRRRTTSSNPAALHGTINDSFIPDPTPSPNSFHPRLLRPEPPLLGTSNLFQSTTTGKTNTHNTVELTFLKGSHLLNVCPSRTLPFFHIPTFPSRHDEHVFDAQPIPRFMPTRKHTRGGGGACRLESAVEFLMPLYY